MPRAVSVQDLGSASASARGEITFEQHGYVDGDGVVHLINDQPMLRTGKTYLIAAGTQPTRRPLFVQPGPHAAVAVTSTAQRAELVQRYADAANE